MIRSRSLRAIALDYLARREHSRAELLRKLLLKGYESADIEAVLNQLQAERLQSDHRFASHFLDQRVRAGSGPFKIIMELEQHGVAKSLIDTVLSAAALDWSILAAELWQRHFVEPARDQKEKVRRQRFMLQRGFEYEHFNKLA